jgi:hypothetical protein
LAIKFANPNGEVQTVQDICVNYKEEKNYDGVPSVEYDCSIIIDEKTMTIKLVFFKEECRWIIKGV